MWPGVIRALFLGCVGRLNTAASSEGKTTQRVGTRHGWTEGHRWTRQPTTNIQSVWLGYQVLRGVCCGMGQLTDLKGSALIPLFMAAESINPTLTVLSLSSFVFWQLRGKSPKDSVWKTPKWDLKLVALKYGVINCFPNAFILGSGLKMDSQGVSQNRLTTLCTGIESQWDVFSFNQGLKSIWRLCVAGQVVSRYPSTGCDGEKNHGGPWFQAHTLHKHHHHRWFRQLQLCSRKLARSAEEIHRVIW